MKRDIERQIRLGVAGGETMRDIAARMTTVLPDVKASSIRTMTRTLVMGLANEARDAVYLENDDIIQGWIQVSTLDSKTSRTCAARDNLAWNKELEPVGHDQIFRRPPLHPNCRSIMQAWLYSADDLPADKREKIPRGSRASMDGQVPASRDFETFLRGKSEDWRREWLGEKRYQLWQEGKIKHLLDIVDPDGNPLTLAELDALFG
jgi:hypothetical protein